VKPGRLFSSIESRALVVVAVLIGLLAVLKPGGDGEDEGGELRPSTFLAGKSGARALYLAAEELKVPVDRWMLPLPEVDEEAAARVRALAIVGPEEPLLPSEAAWLRRWVEEGGRLLYVPRPERKDPLLDLLDLKLERLPGPFSMSPREEAAGVARKAGGDEAAAPLSEVARRLVEESPETLSGFSRELKIGPRAAEAQVLYLGAEGRAAAVLLERGKGRMVLLSHPLPITNERIRKSGAGVLALRALAEISEGETVWFDEFHHGFDERAGLERAVWSFLYRTRTGWAVLQCAGLAVAALFCAGIRLGRPLEPARGRRRSSLEHVDALASAYLGSGARRRPALVLLEGLRLRLGVRSREELEERLKALARSEPRLALPAGELLAALAAEGKGLDHARLADSIDLVLAAAGRPDTGPHSRALKLN
jgi:hypothetical protein